MPIALDIAVIVVSIAFAAFFAGAETALTAASRARMHALEMAGDPRAALVTRLIFGMSNSISEWYQPGGRLSARDMAAAVDAVVIEGLRRRG